MVDGFGPAHLDTVSLWNGVNNFLHSQFALSLSEYEYALGYLRYCFPLIDKYSSLTCDADVVDLVVQHGDKSSGDPFIEFGYPNKLSALDAYGLDGLRDFYQSHHVAISSTLKDEIRDVTKDARFFRPQDVSSYVEGATLFSSQNEYLMSDPINTPIFLMFSTPGRAISRLFERMFGSKYAADGRKWDANFPLVFAMIIAQFRACGSLSLERVERYYRQCYNGLTGVAGHLLNLIGNPSGHFNTSVDNCLAHMCFFAVHAFRSGLSYSDIKSTVEYHCCGDDLLWCDRTQIFCPVRLEATYNSLGMYLEFESYETSSIYELSFVGSTPVDYYYFGTKVLLYIGRKTKLLAKLRCKRRKSTCLDVLSKMCSICSLLFADKSTYDTIRQLIDQFVFTCVSRGDLSLQDARVIGLLAAVQPATLLRQYMSWE